MRLKHPSLFAEETEEIPDDPTPETPPTQDPDEPGGEENIPDEETPAGPPATGESDTSKLLAAGMVLTIFGAVLLLTYRRRAALRAQK